MAEPEVNIHDPLTNKNNCRYYQKRYPSVNDFVAVMVVKVGEMGVSVQLLEYDNIGGMILLSELSKRRIRSINKLIRVGNLEVVTVTRVSEEKGYIDLSKKRVQPEEIRDTLGRYNKSKAVHSIMRHVAITCNKPVLQLYEEFGWDLYKRFGHAHDAFSLAAIGQEEEVFGRYKNQGESLYDERRAAEAKAAETEPEERAEEVAPPVIAQRMDDDVYEALMTNIRRKLTPQPVKLQGIVEITCFQYEGIDAIKRSVRAAQARGTEDMPVSISLIAPPKFVVSTTTVDNKAGLALLNACIEDAKTSIEGEGGSLAVITAPRTVNDQDEKSLAEMMAKLEKETLEIDGDGDED
jgi:translation initiation factor 2 subunit 1